MRTESILAALGLVVVVACDAFGTSSDDATPTMGTSSGSAPTDGGANNPGSDATPIDAAGGDGSVNHDSPFSMAVHSIAGLVAYWRLDDAKAGGSANDASGNNHSAKYSGDGIGDVVGLINGDPDHACELTKAATIAASSINLNGGFSVGILFRRPGTAATTLLEERGFFELSIDFTGRATLALPNINTPLVGGLVGTDAALVIAAVDTSGNQTLWVNGESKTKMGSAPTMPDSTGPFCMGATSQDGTCQLMPLTGVVDEVFVVDRVLSQATVTQLTDLAGVK